MSLSFELAFSSLWLTDVSGGLLHWGSARSGTGKVLRIDRAYRSTVCVTSTACSC